MNEIHNLKACIRNAKSALNCEDLNEAKNELSDALGHTMQLARVLSHSHAMMQSGRTDEAFKLLEGIDV